MDIFVGQTLLSIILDTEIDLAGATTLEILFRKPDMTTGKWTGTQSDTTKIKYQIADANDLDQEGDWEFQAHAVLSGNDGYGDIITQPVLDRIVI